ncbi:MAG: UDP-N-acetylmuramoyl-L-alanine--D-glutamate ligase [Aggregatilineales bacterium]
MSTDPLHGKTALILGFARQGQALATWLPTVGAQVIVSDKADFGDLADALLDYLNAPIRFALGGHPVELLDEVDVVCLSGGVPLDLPIVLAARERGLPLTNDAQLFLERCPVPVIGITGSAGKTTTTMLVGKMCETAGRKTWVGGNTGNVLLEHLAQMQSQEHLQEHLLYVPTHQVVMELSSFQLEIMTRSPEIAAVLNVTPNHLDRHGTMTDYMAAKSHIFLHQQPDQVALFNYDDPGSHALAEQAPGHVAYFSAREMVTDGAFLAGNRLMVVGYGSPDGTPHVVCTRDDIHLRGQHNVYNVLAACALAGAVGVPIEMMRQTIMAFTGVPHRLETVRVVDGVIYVNDSIATAPERVIAAIRSYDEPLVLIAGGRDKKLPWEELAMLIAQRVRRLITFGEHGAVIADLVQTARLLGGQLENVDQAKTLDEAVRRASEVARTGDVVLLSPGGTSYDAYEDFVARGEHFRTLVNALEERDRGAKR